MLIAARSENPENDSGKSLKKDHKLVRRMEIKETYGYIYLAGLRKSKFAAEIRCSITNRTAQCLSSVTRNLNSY